MLINTFLLLSYFFVLYPNAIYNDILWFPREKWKYYGINCWIPCNIPNVPIISSFFISYILLLKLLYYALHSRLYLVPIKLLQSLLSTTLTYCSGIWYFINFITKQSPWKQRNFFFAQSSRISFLIPVLSSTTPPACLIYALTVN